MAEAQVAWQNRIVGTGVEPAASFMANPLNWRVHPKPQQAAMKGALDEIGWIQNVIVNRTTGNLLDGHLRITLALRQGDDTPVPVTYVELSEGEEALALLTLDPIAAMAKANGDKINELLQQAETGESALQEMLSKVAADAGLFVGDKDGKLDLDIADEKPKDKGELVSCPKCGFEFHA